MNNGILLVEDEASLNRAIGLKLSKEGYNVYTAACIEEANRIYDANEISLIICDIGLPDGNGLDFCTNIRKKSSVMFLFLTAMDSEIDIVNGYEAGADDYITKPFSLLVLISKVNAIMKRNKSEESKTICSGDIVYFFEENRISKKGEYIQLTANEQKLLIYFMQNPMRILSKKQLLDAMWDIDCNFVDENTLAVNIRRLREKIEDEPSKPKYIKNIRGLGYIWERSCEKK